MMRPKPIAGSPAIYRHSRAPGRDLSVILVAAGLLLGLARPALAPATVAPPRDAPPDRAQAEALVRSQLPPSPAPLIKWRYHFTTAPLRLKGATDAVRYWTCGRLENADGSNGRWFVLGVSGGRVALFRLSRRDGEDAIATTCDNAHDAGDLVRN